MVKYLLSVWLCWARDQLVFVLVFVLRLRIAMRRWRRRRRRRRRQWRHPARGQNESDERNNGDCGKYHRFRHFHITYRCFGQGWKCQHVAHHLGHLRFLIISIFLLLVNIVVISSVIRYWTRNQPTAWDLFWTGV